MKYTNYADRRLQRVIPICTAWYRWRIRRLVETAIIKLGSVVSDITGKTLRAQSSSGSESIGHKFGGTLLLVKQDWEKRGP
jgi:hypothetical protein